MEEIKIGKRLLLWFIGILLLLSAIIGTCSVLTSSARKATHIDDATATYEEFQEIYNTCSKLNTDLCNMKDLPETDKMFEQFSKPQRVNTLKTQLNRWVEEYNGKSKMWGRSLWKSSSLPYQLSVTQFNCYN